MRGKKLFAIMIMAICMVLPMTLVGCDDTVIVTDFEIYNEIVRSNVATKGYTMDIITVITATGKETGYVKKTVTVEGSIATTIISERRLSFIDIDGKNTSEYIETTHNPVVTNNYVGETLTNDVSFVNMQLEGSIFVNNGAEITLKSIVKDISKTLSIIDITGIENCVIEVSVDPELKLLNSFVISYERGISSTTLTYKQVI